MGYLSRKNYEPRSVGTPIEFHKQLHILSIRKTARHKKKSSPVPLPAQAPCLHGIHALIPDGRAIPPPRAAVNIEGWARPDRVHDTVSLGPAGPGPAPAFPAFRQGGGLGRLWGPSPQAPEKLRLVRGLSGEE